MNKKVKIIFSVIILITILMGNCICNAESSEKSFEEFSESLDTVEEDDGVVSINRVIGSALTIIQILMFFLTIIFLGRGIYFFIKTENKKGFINIIIAIISFGINGFIGSIKTFKPIIYIYPEKETNVNVKLGNKEKLTCTYPKYENEWNVCAKPNGDLIDLKSNRKLYALYWEGLNTNKQNFEEGFIVEGEKTTEFLEEKLEFLGLNEREAEEFIVYWLPQMEHNKYNYIRFETIDEINQNMPLEISPKPETLIRINMVFKPLRKTIEIKEQQLNKSIRKGYTVVEWGGTKI